MRVTLKEVAQKAGVSRSAVSRSFTEGASVSEETRRKVMRAAKSLGYHPNVLASSLTTRRTKLIGLVADNFVNPVFLTVFDLFTKRIQKRGFRPLLVNLAGQTDPADSVLLLQQYSVDGVIVASSTLPASFAAAFREAGLPVVHSFGRYSGESQTHVVGVDNRYCGQLAAQALLDFGYERVEFLGGPESSTSTQDRLAGFSGALAARGIDVPVSFARGYTYAAGYEAMAERLSRGNPADAYFCGDDVIAVGAMDALAAHGFRVPEDVGLIGFNDMEMSSWNCVNLTTIRQPVAQIISASVDLVIDLIQQPDLPLETRLMPCEIVKRSTLRQHGP
ncbi:MAG: LacI family DNA-binding transcriptional regulator [Geminicoccaceae bacterium]